MGNKKYNEFTEDLEFLIELIQHPKFSPADSKRDDNKLLELAHQILSEVEKK